MQYTLRNIPPDLDRALRKAANEQHKSLNRVAVEILQRATGLVGEGPVKRRDLSDIAGTWQDDPEIDAALEDQRRVEPQPGLRVKAFSACGSGFDDIGSDEAAVTVQPAQN